MNRRDFTLALAAGAAAVGAGRSPLRSAPLDEVRRNGVLRVAVMQDYAPFGSIGPDMSSVGLDVDLARLVAGKLGVRLDMTPSIGSNRIPLLLTGKVDLVIACLGKTAERAKVIDFSSPYASTFNGVFGAADMAVAAPADLAGKTVGASRGGTEDLQLTQVAPAGAIVRRFEDTANTLAAFASRQIDFIAMGSTTATAFAKSSPRRLELKFRLSDEPTYIGVTKGDQAMLAKVNEIVAELQVNGTLSELSSKWLGYPLPSTF